MKVIIFVSLIFLLYSCGDYYAPFPVEKESKSINCSELLGQWKYISSSADSGNGNIIDSHILEISKANGRNLNVKTIPDGTPDSIFYMSAFVSDVEHVKYANVRFFDKGKLGNEFLIMRIDFREDNLSCSTINKDSIKMIISDSKDLYGFLKDNQGNNIWNITYNYKKIK